MTRTDVDNRNSPLPDSARSHRDGRPRRWLAARLAQAATAALGLVLIGALVGSAAGWMGVDQATHFAVQYAAAGTVGGLFALASKRWLRLAAGLIVAVPNAWIAVPDVLSRRPPARSEATARLHVLTANVHWRSSEYAPLVALLGRLRPDVVGLVEVTPEWTAAIEPAMGAYPFRLLAPSPGSAGVALYSRLPLEGAKVVDLGAGLPSIEARVLLAGRRIDLVVTHPRSPVSAARRRDRDRQLAGLAAWAQSRRWAVIVGDLNTSPYAPAFRRMLAAGNLRDSRQGFGWQPTWPRWMPLVWIPIDHILVGDGLAVLDRQVEPSIGSDHYPVSAWIGVADGTLIRLDSTRSISNERKNKNECCATRLSQPASDASGRGRYFAGRPGGDGGGRQEEEKEVAPRASAVRLHDLSVGQRLGYSGADCQL